MMDRELQILREAALISMEKRLQLQEAKELADLREAALDSARERKLSSASLGKRKMESPPSYHNRTKSGEEFSPVDSDGSGEHTPKMSAYDSIPHTPPRNDHTQGTVFTVKMSDTMLLKRSVKRSSSSSRRSDLSDVSPPPQPPKSEGMISVKVRQSPAREVTPPPTRAEDISSEAESPQEMEHSPRKSEKSSQPLLQISPVKRASSPVPSPPVKRAESPVLVDRVSSASEKETTKPSPPKKQKKKHKKKKSSSKVKKAKHRDLSLEKEPLPSKSSKSKQKKHNGNGVSASKTVSKASKVDKTADKAIEARAAKLQKHLKKEIINEIDSKIDKNIEMLQKAKRQKQENRNRTITKKIISEISSAEEEELLKTDKKRLSQSHRKKKQKDANVSADSPPAVVDLSVSIKSKREFERMKAEHNKNPSTGQPRISESSTGGSPRKKQRTSSQTENGSTHSTPRVENGSQGKRSSQESLVEENGTKADRRISDGIPIISEREELELLGEVPSPNLNPGGPPVRVPSGSSPDILDISAPQSGIPPTEEDVVNIMREDSFSDSDEDDVVNISSGKTVPGEKKKKVKKSKKKKHKDDKKKKKKRKKHPSASSGSSDSESGKKKVKIDKSELNKIVQFLKLRDEAQKAVDVTTAKTGYNPKLINKETKPIEIKLKSKPKR